MKAKYNVLKSIEITEPKTLEGICKDKNFEKITNLEVEIRKLRKELGNQIVERYN
ncbi:MAG: hypothetical protein MUF15_12065 [Acidobacteria bacterium]|jgi:hypothetical protein|nr:hypothetical protein [Acidobacteriota bacterium]